MELHLKAEVAKAGAEERAYAEKLSKANKKIPSPDIVALYGMRNELHPEGKQVKIKPGFHKVRSEYKKETGSDDSGLAEKFLQDMVNVQHLQLNQNQQLLYKPSNCLLL